jgi:hypothetical protein
MDKEIEVLLRVPMDKEIEILFRVPYRILQKVSEEIQKKGRFWFAFQFAKEELLDQIEKADSAMAKAEDDFRTRIKNSEVSSDHVKQFMLAKAEYSIKSREVKDSILSRLNPLASTLASD